MSEARSDFSARSRWQRGEEMKVPDEVAAMLRLRALGWGVRRIATELGCSHMTVRRYLDQGGWVGFQTPRRSKALDGLEDWLAERFRQHRGNADVVRQELLAEHGMAVSLRTVERAVAHLRRELEAEARATVRFETPPGRQMQIDFGQRQVMIAGAPVRAFVFVATLGYSRRPHVRAFRHERQAAWFEGMESAFRTFGGVPAEVLLDNARALVERHDAATREVVQAGCVRQALGFPAPGLRAVPGADQGQGRAWCRLREEQRDRRSTIRELGGLRGPSRRLDAGGRRGARAWYDGRGTDRTLRAG
jgi:transposase